MSIEAAKQFLVKISTDAEAASKADKVYAQALLKLAADLGYQISDGDLQSAMAGMASNDDLSDAELEHVAGGVRVRDSVGFGGGSFKFFPRGT